MTSFSAFWRSDRGFIWLLAVSIAAIPMAQFSSGEVGSEMLMLRVTFFVFTVVAIFASVLTHKQKLAGYGVGVALFILSIAMVFVRGNVLSFIHGSLMSIYMLFIIALVVVQIFEGEKMTVQKIGGGVAAYILIGHLWTSMYMMVYAANPSAFSFQGNPIEPSQALRQLSYFSFVTLTTVGFGDILASGPYARVLVTLEGLLGQLFPAVLIAKLVSLHIGKTR